MRAGKERVVAARKARRADARERGRARVAQNKAYARELKARVRWAKGVLERAHAEGGVWGGIAGVVAPADRVAWPVSAPLSPGVAERDARETELAVVALDERRVRLKRALADEVEGVRAVQLGAHGGPGASARGVWAAKRARWVAKRDRAEVGWLGIGKRARRGADVESRIVLVDGGWEGIPSPEVWRRVCREEVRRAPFKYKFKCSSARARRMLRLLKEQQRRRAQECGRGRVRLRLF